MKKCQISLIKNAIKIGVISLIKIADKHQCYYSMSATMCQNKHINCYSMVILCHSKE